MARTGVAALIGNTPLVEIQRLNPHRARGVRILAKLESRNPGGSVKDRAALAMIEEGERSGALAPGKTLIDATSGNTGIAYAMLAAARGVPCEIVMPANASAERQAVLRAYGATLDLTDPLEGQDGAIDRVRERVKESPSRWFYPDQYSNPANPRAHYESTGPEILRDAPSLTHFVAGLGTSGTLMGAGRFLRENKPIVELVALEPAGPMHGLEGLKHMASSHVPAIFRPEDLPMTRAAVATERAVELTRALAREEGLFVGSSSGAALAGAIDVAARALPGSVIVAMFPDGGERYLSTPLWRP